MRIFGTFVCHGAEWTVYDSTINGWVFAVVNEDHDAYDRGHKHPWTKEPTLAQAPTFAELFEACERLGRHAGHWTHPSYNEDEED